MRFPLAALVWLSLTLLIGMSVSWSAHACGWWGDGEMNIDDGDVIVIGSDGMPVTPESRGVGNRDLLVITLRANRMRETPGNEPKEAVRLYLAAAERGHAPAQNNLGAMYEKGLGVQQSNRKAAFWYRRAAIQGEPHAQHSLGRMFLHGHGVGRNMVAGMNWLQRSANQGHRRACADLADLYWNGTGVPIDNVLALGWWLIAAEQGDGESSDLAAAARHGMEEMEIDAAEDMAYRWRKDVK